MHMQFIELFSIALKLFMKRKKRYKSYQAFKLNMIITPLLFKKWAHFDKFNAVFDII